MGRRCSSSSSARAGLCRTGAFSRCPTTRDSSRGLPGAGACQKVLRVSLAVMCSQLCTPQGRVTPSQPAGEELNPCPEWQLPAGAARGQAKDSCQCVLGLTGDRCPTQSIPSSVLCSRVHVLLAAAPTVYSVTAEHQLQRKVLF